RRLRHYRHRSARQRRNALPDCAYDRRNDDVDGVEYRPWADRADVDGGARHGHRGRAHGYSSAADETTRVRSIFLLLRCRRGALGLPLVWRRGIDRFFDQRELHGPVHDHYRRPWEPARFVPLCGADLYPADHLTFRAASAPPLAARCDTCAPIMYDY